MQVGGIGSHAHTVSHCVHEEDAVGKKSGGAAALKAMQSVESQLDPQTPGEIFSFSEWGGNFLKSARKLIGQIWGADGVDSLAGSGEVKGGSERITDRAQFAGMPDKGTEAGESHTLVQRLKYKVRSLTNDLAKRFGFSGRQNFHTGAGRQQEEMKRRRIYTQNGTKIDSVQPPDSYLLDSYDKNGEYSKISTKR